jgi:tRNA G18 (ribose-2'-O)-methylase SpoU
LLAEGDRRNVVDKYRYWRHEAIVHDLDAQRHDFHVGVENWGHDFNIGSVIRTANAFNAKAFHIVGKRRWNRRGAMVTDRYQHEYHHPSVEDLVDWAAAAPAGGGAHGIPVIGIDNLPGSQPIETYRPAQALHAALRQEGPGLSPQARGRRRWRSWTSPSSVRRARSTPALRQRSRCTPGCAAMSSANRLGS